METILNFIEVHSQNAHWIFFCLIILSGFCLPISEDAIVIAAGAISAIYVPDHILRMIIWLLAGYFLSAWLTYWIGRLLGPKLYNFKWFRRILSKKRMERIKAYFVRNGLLTFMVVRFLPGGARNALFLTSGLSKMPFPLFVLRDGFALIFPFSILFTSGYLFGANLELILHYFEVYSTLAFSIMFSLLALLAAYFWIIRHWLFKNNGTKD